MSVANPIKITVVTDKAKVSPANAKDRPFPLEWTRNIGIAAHIDASGYVAQFNALREL